MGPGALACLFGAFGLFHAAPAPAQTTEVWSAMLTYGGTGPGGYCDGSATHIPSNCDYGSLSDNSFTLDTIDYTVTSLRIGGTNLHLTLNKTIPDSTNLEELTLQFDSWKFKLNKAKVTKSTRNTDRPLHNYHWEYPSGFDTYSENDEITVKLLKTPLVVTFSPRDGRVTTTSSTNITLTFNQAIRKDSSGTELVNADLSNILTLAETDENGTAIPYSATINSAKTIITIDPSSDLPDGDVYVAISDNWYNADSSKGEAANATFTVDTTGPVPVFDPTGGDTLTDPDLDFFITFDEEIRKNASGSFFETFEDISAVVTLTEDDENGTAIPYATTTQDGDTTLQIDPVSSLANGTVYLAISNGYYDEHGNQGKKASATYTIAADVGPPPPRPTRSPPRPPRTRAQTRS